MKYDDYSLRQIRISKDLYDFLKKHCHTQHQKMFTLYASALTWFFEKYATNPINHYHASCKNGHRLSLWIHKDQIAKIRTFATVAQVSDARIIATALILYLRENKISPNIY